MKELIDEDSNKFAFNISIKNIKLLCSLYIII